MGHLGPFGSARGGRLRGGVDAPAHGQLGTAPPHVAQPVLRWFHALVWALLALSSFIRASLVPGGSRVANVVALLALPAYTVFLKMLAIDRRSSR